MNKPFKLKLMKFLFVAMLCVTKNISAASLVLTNSEIAQPGGGGLWSLGANWFGGSAPGASDSVILTNSGAAMSALPFQGLAPDASWNNLFDGIVPVTSMVDSMTIGGFWATQTNLFNTWYVGNQLPNGAHNLYITNKLNIVSTVPMDTNNMAANTLAVGTGVDSSNMLVYATIQGPGSLNVTNPVGCIWVGQGSQFTGTGPAAHEAILDMSGLNNFNCLLDNIFTASDFLQITLTTDPNARPQGMILFAQTNHITLLSSNFPAFVVGYEPDNNGSTYWISNLLGQVNYMNFDSMMVGGPKMAFSGCGLYFAPSNVLAATPALVDCYAKFRNVDGVSRQNYWSIGDSFYSPGTTTTAYGTVNFARGSVDALVDTIYLGRGGVSSITTGTSVGTLTFGLGTTNLSVIDVNQVEMADMMNQKAPCQGNLNVYSNGTLNVNNYLRLINIPPGTNIATSRALFNILGGTVNVAGSILNNATPGGGNCAITLNNGGTLNLQPNNAKPPGDISVTTFNLGYGSLKNFGTLNVSNLVVSAPNATFALNNGQGLSPAGTGYGDILTIGATNLVPPTYVNNLDGSVITNNGNGLVGLSMSNATVYIDVGASSDKIVVNGGITLSGINQVFVNPVSGFSTGTYTVFTYNNDTSLLDCNGNANYGLSGNVASQLKAAGPITNSAYVVSFNGSTPGVISMTISLGVSTNLTWVGDGSVNAWDVVGANNWINGSVASKFYQYDAVTFDDTGSASPAVRLASVVYPMGVTVNSTKNYVLAGSGQIAGIGSLVKNGTGTLNVMATNLYTGGTVVNAGMLRLGDGASVFGTLGDRFGTVNLASGSTLSIAVPSAQTQYISNGISGSGQINVEGPGAVVLAGTNQVYTGNFNVTGGALVPATLAAISQAWSPTSNLIKVTNNATFDINGLTISNIVTISGSGLNGNGALVNNGGNQSGAPMQVILAGDSTVGGLYRMDLNNRSTSTPGGLTGNGFNLTKVGTNCVSLFNVAASAWTNNLGNIQVSSGVLRLQNGTLLTTNASKTLTVAAGATFEMNNVWAQTPVNISLLLQNGACFYGTGGTGTNVVGTTTNVQANLFSGTVALNGSDFIDVSTNSVLAISGVIGGGGSLIKGIGSHPTSATTAISTGVGSLVLSGTNIFTGDLAIQTGTVFLTNNGSILSAANINLAGGSLNASGRSDGTLTLGAGQKISGIGLLVGNINVPAAATMAPGLPTGLLTNIGNVVLSGTTAMNISKTNGIITSSLLGVSGGLKLGGTLSVVFSGSGLTNGDKFQLFSSPSISSNFAVVTLPAGAVWTDKTGIDGSIVVASVVTEPVAAPKLTATVSAGSLYLSWPIAYSSYVLQAQTNTINASLSTNWTTIGTLNNAITMPINIANPSVFFRLKHN